MDWDDLSFMCCYLIQIQLYKVSYRSVGNFHNCVVCIFLINKVGFSMFDTTMMYSQLPQLYLSQHDPNQALLIADFAQAILAKNFPLGCFRSVFNQDLSRRTFTWNFCLSKCQRYMWHLVAFLLLCLLCFALSGFAL